MSGLNLRGMLPRRADDDIGDVVRGVPSEKGDPHCTRGRSRECAEHVGATSARTDSYKYVARADVRAHLACKHFDKFVVVRESSQHRGVRRECESGIRWTLSSESTNELGHEVLRISCAASVAADVKTMALRKRGDEGIRHAYDFGNQCLAASNGVGTTIETLPGNARCLAHELGLRRGAGDSRHHTRTNRRRREDSNTSPYFCLGSGSRAAGSPLLHVGVIGEDTPRSASFLFFAGTISRSSALNVLSCRSSYRDRDDFPQATTT